jgi:hypothetical protein
MKTKTLPELDRISLPDEVWKPIEDWGYWVSDQGRVWSERRRRLIGSWDARYGYVRVSLVWNDYGEQRSYGVHQMVMMYHSRHPKEGEEVDHKNGNKSDNRLTNLYYRRTRKEHKKAERTREYCKCPLCRCTHRKQL